MNPNQSEGRFSDPDREFDPQIDPGLLKWLNLTLSTTGTYPLYMVRRLIQLGYEPMPFTTGTSFTGRPYLAYPNMFKYIKHVKSTDGFFGLYRGLIPRVLEFFTYKAIYDAIHGDKTEVDYLDDTETESYISDIEFESWKSFIKEIKLALGSHVVALILSHPLRVIATRSLAEFAGHEGIYTSIISSIKEISYNEGISGFFSGIIPTLIGGVLGLVASSLLTKLIMQYVFKHKYNKNNIVKGAVSIASDLTVSCLLYPFSVTSVVMLVSGSRLRIAQQPEFLVKNWFECLYHLRQRHLLYRGFSIFNRKVVA